GVLWLDIHFLLQSLAIHLPPFNNLAVRYGLALMKMRELETKTGVSRQMIQFYFKNGMLPDPERPKRNVAIYNENHVNAILSIRQLQSEGRLSIEEIKQFLAGNTTSKTTRAAVFTHL